MYLLDEFRDRSAVKVLIKGIQAISTRNYRIMEICGGQTHTIMKYGLEQLLPDRIKLIHGPGCPVCVTPAFMIDRAIQLSSFPGHVLASYGDMLRVPGSSSDLLSAKADGADVRMIYTPLEAVRMAQSEPEKKIIFFSIGFETTAPVNAASLKLARELKLNNYFLLTAQFLIPPAVEHLLSLKNNLIDGFLAPGHVCTVTGIKDYELISRKYKVPVVITGFEPVDILQGIYLTIRQLENGSHITENQYSRVVAYEGNPAAQKLINETFEIIDANWRGIGIIPESGYGLREHFRDFDAGFNFDFTQTESKQEAECIAGSILQGLSVPFDCPFFGKKCTPSSPLGAPMVSAEGVCSAYYNYRDIK